MSEATLCLGRSIDHFLSGNYIAYIDKILDFSNTLYILNILYQNLFNSNLNTLKKISDFVTGEIFIATLLRLCCRPDKIA